MIELFNKLAQQATITKQINCIDAVISFSSAEEDLIDLFTGPLGYFLPAEASESAVTYSCIVAPTSAVKNWPDSLFQTGKSITPINDITVGSATLVATSCGMTLVMDTIGSIYHSGNGHFLCLVKPPERALKKWESLNVLGLATLLISEVLLLTNKLLIHAGAVGKAGKCQVWTGDSGSGKTTRILNMVNRGWDFYGEDQIIVGRNDNGQWCVWPFWRQIKVSAETSRLFPTQQDLSIRPPNARKKYAFDNIEEVLLVTKPTRGTVTSIFKLLPGNKHTLQTLEFNVAFQHLAPGFMHSLLPDSTSRVIDLVLDFIADVPVHLVSWDMLDQSDTMDFEP